jgi:hypothetical protein
MPDPALGLAGLAAATLLATLGYFTHVPLARPTIGALDLSDVAVLFVMITLAPCLYVVLPPTAVAAVVCVGLVSSLLLILEPLVGRANWPVVLALVAIDGALVSIGPTPAACAANDALAVLALMAIANIWAQSGMRARDAALLAAALTIYDAVATSWLGLTGRLFSHVWNVPFAPVLAWPTTHGHAYLLGAGDVLVAALLPVVITKAYGRRPGVLAGVATFTSIVAAIAISAHHELSGVLPVMLVLGPVAVGCWFACHRRQPRERTTYEYRLALELAPGPRVLSDPRQCSCELDARAHP